MKKKKDKIGCLKPGTVAPLDALFATCKKVKVNSGFHWLEDDAIKEGQLVKVPRTGEIFEYEPRRFGYMKGSEKVKCQTATGAMAESRAEFHQRNLDGNMLNYAMSPSHELPDEKEMHRMITEYTTTANLNTILHGSLTFDSVWPVKTFDEMKEHWVPGAAWTYDGKPWPPEGVSDDFMQTVGKIMEDIMRDRLLYGSSVKLIKGTLTPKGRKQMEEMAKRVMMWMIEKKFVDEKITVVEYMKLEKELIKVLNDEEEDKK